MRKSVITRQNCISAFTPLSKMNVYNTLGSLCTAHPEVCLYASGKLEDDKTEQFATKELNDHKIEWSKQHTSEHTSPEFSDAFWLAQCILKASCREGNIFQSKGEETAGELIDCHYILSEAPKAIATTQQNDPIRTRVSEVINDLKRRIRNRNVQHTGHPECVMLHIGTDTDELQDIRDIAKGELTKQSDRAKYEETCDKLMSELAVWAGVKFTESPLDSYLFNNECKTNEAREAAMADVRHSYWLMKAWIVAIETIDEDDDDIDEVIRNALQVAKKMCDKVHEIQEIHEHQTSFVELCYFCEYRVQVRNVLKEQLSLASSIERLYESVYGDN